MALNLSSKSWAHKVIPEFTDAELVDAIKTYQAALPDANHDVYRGLIREWERRHGLNDTEGN